MTTEETLCDCGDPMEADDVHCENCATCLDCGRVEVADHMNYVNPGRWSRLSEGLYCADCSTQCESCLEPHVNNEMTDIGDGSYTRPICQSCMDEYYSYCDGCSTTMLREDLTYSEHTDQEYCESCYREHGSGDRGGAEVHHCRTCGSDDLHFHILAERYLCDCGAVAVDSRWVVLAHPIPDTVRTELRAPVAA